MDELYRAREHAAWLASIVASSSDAIIGKTVDGIITSWNAGAERIYGYLAEEMIGGSIRTIVPKDRYGELDDLLARIKQGQRVDPYETVRIHQDGRRLHILVGLSPVLGPDGTVVGASAIGRDISARKWIELTLQRSEAELADFFENAPMGLHWADARGIIQRANQAELRMLGYTADEYIGHHVREFHVDPGAADELFARLSQGETVRDWNTRLRRKDGSIRDVRMSANVLWQEGQFVHSRCFTRDITEQKRAQEALRDSEERLSLALQVGRMGAWEWDLRTNHVVWSTTLEAIHGLAPGTFGGRFEDFQRHLHPDDLDQVLGTMEDTLQDRGSYQISYRILLPDGGIAWLEARGRVLVDSAGQPERFIGVCLDVTDRKRFEEALQEETRRKDEFLAMLSHELRNPLAPILNCMQILRDAGTGPEPAQKAWDMLDRQVSHLGRLIEDLLDVSRVASGNILLRRECLNLVALVRDTVNDHQGVLDQHQIGRTLELPPGPLWVDGDPTRLSQALRNLLHNAAKFTDPGGGVTITLHRENDAAVLSVRDTGIGIDSGMLARLFEPFVRADHGLDQSRSGLGLGLSLVRAMVGLHGGSVEAKSPGPGKGSEFIIRLPLSAGPKEIPASVPASPSQDDGHRILLIEDNADAAESMRLLLELLGHEVQMASEGASGIKQALSFRPRVVLCDIGLPGELDGYAVARALRKDPTMSSTLLVALTGYGQAEDQRRASDAGFDVHLTKPVRRDDLERVISTVEA